MIQVLPAVQRKRSVGQALAQGLAEGLPQAIKIYQEHQKRKEGEQQYQEENETYKQLTGRNLSKNPDIRKTEIGYALQGQNQLKSEEQRGQNQLQKENLKYTNKASEAAAKLAGEKKTQQQLASFADKLEADNPNSPVHKTIASIYRTELPMDQKTEIVKSLTGVDPFKVQQQQRLQLDSVLKRYTSRLKELDDEIKNVRNPSSAGKAEVQDLKKQRMALRSERDQLLDFKSLNGMDNEEEDFEDEVEDEFDADERGPKVAFNPANKEHKAKAEQLYKKFKDKEKVREILSKEFKGL